jgi:hypothetical protein
MPLLFTARGSNQNPIKIPILTLQQRLPILQRPLVGVNQRNVIFNSLIPIVHLVGGGGIIDSRIKKHRIIGAVIKIRVLRFLRKRENYGVGRREFSGEVFFDGFPVDVSDRGDAESEGVLEVIGELDFGVLDAVN